MMKLEEVKEGIRTLRPILEDRAAIEYLNLFDKFMAEWELGLAFQCVCDYLNEPHVPAPDAKTLDRLYVLHSAMEMEDDCVDLLRTKAAASRSVQSG
jgi:hypothetical protein